MAFALLALSIVFIVASIVVLKIHPFLALILAAALVGILSPRALSDGEDDPQAVVALELTASGFGVTAAAIGIVIVLAAIIGRCLMESGAADRIVSTFLSVLGERRAGLALMTSGYLLAIPVFFDTVFLLLVPLARSLRMRTGRNYVLYIMAICGGAFTTHSLVPPTPGPLAMAETLGVDLGVAILTGLVLGLLPALLGLALCHVVDRRLVVSFPGASQPISRNDESKLPGFWISISPVALPMVLIAGASLADAFASASPGLRGVLLFLGNKNLALLAASLIAAWLLRRQKKLTLAELSIALEPAVASAGVIILITSAGGAFGSMLSRIGIDEALSALSPGAGGTSYLLLAFVVAAVMKVAQGSGTVSIITTAGILSAILPTASELPYHVLYIYAAIGFGSGLVSWMNDSGFWVVCKMSGFTEKETFFTWSFVLVVIGLAGLVEVLLLSRLLPLV